MNAIKGTIDKFFPDITKIVQTSILQQLPDVIYQVTGLGTGIHTPSGELITTLPEDSVCSFCLNMYCSSEGYSRCLCSNARGQLRAYKSGKPYIYYCHAALVDVSAPIIVKGKHAGSVSFGQLLLEPLTSAYRDRVQRCISQFPEDFQQVQLSALEEVPVVSLRKVRSMAQLLSVIANNVVNLIVSNTYEKAFNAQTAKLLEETKERAALEREIKDAQLSVKEAELRALQAQINPHFLFNTLDSIRWLAVLHDAGDIQNSIECLSQLLRYSLYQRDSVVSLSLEVYQIQRYLVIHKLRLGDRFSFQIKIKPEILNFKLPKLTLQPIVENSIIHGIYPKAGAVNLHIGGWLHDKNLAIIEISDNGVGMSKKTLSQLKTAMDKKIDCSTSKHVGLSNVQRRLKYNFGDNAGLTVRSRLGIGSIVQIRIPHNLKNKKSSDE